MTQEQIKRACAELDGFKPVTKMIKEWDVIDYNGNGEWVEKPREMFERDGASVFPEFLPNYTTSYDAILPLLQKWFDEDITNGIRLADSIRKMTGIVGSISPIRVLHLTPRQLCEALLRALGKWEGEDGLSPR